MRNRYAGDCDTCGTHVEEDEGFVNNVDGSWQTRCEDCSAHDEHTIRITMHSDGKRALVKPENFLGGDHFDNYRAACADAGTRYHKDSKGNLASLDALGRLVKELKARGFDVSVDPEVAGKMQAHAGRATEEVGAADGRLDRLDAVLAERGEALFPFQRVGVRWLTSRSGALLNDEMGLGKTVQALASLPDNVPVLVVCPAIAKGVWRRETKRWRPEYSVSVLKGRKSFRWPAAGEIIVTNYDILPKQAPSDCPANLVLIADEAHAIKNNKSQRTKRFRALADITRKNDGKVWLLTATPMLNRPPELWSLLVAANCHTDSFGNWQSFVDLFNGTPGQWGGYEWGKPAPAVKHRLRRVSLRRERIEVLPDLPTKMHSTLMVNGLDRKTRQLCDAALEALEEAGIDLEAAIEAADETAVRGVAFEEMSTARAALATAKIPHLLQLVTEYEEAGEPLVVFSAHRAPIDALAERDGWAVITGDTPHDERTRIEEAFQAGQLRGLGATIQAGGMAITLTRGSQMIFVDLAWTPALNAQAEDRCCRIGQTRGVNIIRLIAEHALDENVMKLLGSKQLIIGGSVGASRRVDVGDTPGELRAAAQAVAAAAETGRAATERRSQAAVERSHASPRPACRGPATPKEEWAVAALRRLAADDPDRAGMQNGVGFNKLDGDFGHSLAAAIGGAGLTDKQWAAAIKLSKKYWKQVGPCP